jgi:hypothetical protein
VNVEVPWGGTTEFHTDPPSSVVMMDGTLKPTSPTATHVVEAIELLEAQEIAVTLASGVNEAVVCH